MKGNSHSRLNASPLREVSAKAEAADATPPNDLILSPADLMRTKTPPIGRPSMMVKPYHQLSGSNSRQNSPVTPDSGLLESPSGGFKAVTRVMNMFRTRSSSSATAEDKKRLWQKVGTAIYGLHLQR
jgi:hypothetical protein